MLPARTITRSAPRAIRTARAPLRQARFQSTSASSSTSTSNGSSHFASGAAGGLVGALVLYGIYSFTPSGRMSSTINKTATEATKKYTEASKKLQQSTPDADQAIEYIKNFCYTYVAWVPGGRQYVDAAFKDVDTVKQNHHDEFTQIVNDAWKQFQDASKSGMSLETASKAWEVLADMSKKLGNLAGDAMGDILENHPEAKQKFGGSIDQLKEMGEQYGPEAKKQIDETYKQVKDIVAGGFTAANISKAKKILEEKVEQIRKMGDEAWDKAMESAKPYLDKNPKIKELIEKNAQALKQGNAKEVFDKAKEAVDSGNMGNLEEYVKKAGEKAKAKGDQLTGGLDKYFDMIPSGGDILSKIKQLQEVADKHKEEGEKLLKETIDEIKQILEKKSDKAKDIAEKAKKEAK